MSIIQVAQKIAGQRRALALVKEELIREKKNVDVFPVHDDGAYDIELSPLEYTFLSLSWKIITDDRNRRRTERMFAGTFLRTFEKSDRMRKFVAKHQATSLLRHGRSIVTRVNLSRSHGVAMFELINACIQRLTPGRSKFRLPCLETTVVPHLSFVRLGFEAAFFDEYAMHLTDKFLLHEVTYTPKAKLDIRSLPFVGKQSWMKLFAALADVLVETTQLNLQSDGSKCVSGYRNDDSRFIHRRSCPRPQATSRWQHTLFELNKSAFSKLHNSLELDLVPSAPAPKQQKSILNTTKKGGSKSTVDLSTAAAATPWPRVPRARSMHDRLYTTTQFYDINGEQMWMTLV